MNWKSELEFYLTEYFSETVTITNSSPVGGGSINETFKIRTSNGDYFLKKNSKSRFPGMFIKEDLGIKVLKDAGVIKVPEVLFSRDGEVDSYLTMELIETGTPGNNFWQQFAFQLSELHRKTNDYFGLDHDNYIGSLEQFNNQHDHWPEFFQIQRLEVQLKLARDTNKINSSDVKIFDRFFRRLDIIFPEEPPSLLHGDLWGGNYMVNVNGDPFIIDPAVYYGHREMDIAMTRLFGGFDSQFYNYYNEYFPMEKGWEQRMDYCNLYPLMVHVNLFGGGYINSVRAILNKF